ncbi:hypothetical protein [Bradyrhizobium sp. 6(2017)]|uniref:hypothetical protein n=1 Tax=Bradyrhizobium sp. 6(2017) TaxID=1197460 RepID=UPI0013E17D06|nr:hypothetical protein [Bradyrhizobium sp. 6(2017)]QIG91575.1 hypothetical protein G6P99_02970 [Bradyrhizobium sp. 6(2017)]
MANRPKFAITRPIEETPYAAAPDIVIGYPHRLDWLALYQPGPLRMPNEQGIYRDVMALESRYQDMKGHHERTVKAQLDLIPKRATGRAVLAEIGRKPSHKVTIFPFDFLPSGQWKSETAAATEATVIMPTPEMIAAWRANPTVPPAALQPQLDGMLKGTQWSRLDFTYPATGAGTGVYMFYTAQRFDDQPMGADDALLHELVHAARLAKGLSFQAPVSGSYRNMEEFFASVVQMVYRSERRQSIFDYAGAPIDAASFLDKNLTPSPRLLMGWLRSQQGTFYAALTKADASFNPMRQADAEAAALTRKIEHAT